MKLKGFTLVELLIVIAIIGIITAIAVPNLLTALDKGKLKATMGDMKIVGLAIHSYTEDLNMAPGGGIATTISELEPILTPFYIMPLPQKDGWNQDFQYNSGAIGPSQILYSIISFGKDRQSTAMDINNNGFVITKSEDFNNDICFSNGSFTYCSRMK